MRNPKNELRRGWRHSQTARGGGSQGNPNPGQSVQQKSLMSRTKSHTGGAPRPMYL
jgi:hypothetical protein